MNESTTLKIISGLAQSWVIVTMLLALFVAPNLAQASENPTVFLSWQSQATAEYLNKIKKQGYLRVIVDPTLPPLESFDKNSKLIGFDIDFANMLAKDMGVKAKFIQTTYDAAFSDLDSNPNSVIISGIKKLAEAKPGYQFVEYAEISQLILGKSKSTDVNDFVGKQIGVLSASQARLDLQKLYDSGLKIKRIRGFENWSSMENALRSGIVDFIIADSVAVNKFQKNAKNKWLISDRPFCTESLALVVRDKDIGLAYLLKNIIQKHRDEIISKSFRRWFQYDTTD